MAIRMRVTKQEDPTCTSCGATKKKSLDMFDVKIGESLICLCDICVESMLTKSLTASCYTNGRVKQPREIRLINERARNKRGFR